MKSRLALIFTVSTALLSAQNWKFGGSFENTLWVADDIPPAFLEFDKGYLLDPRFSLSFDYQPDPRFYLHTTVRADRGFDPGTQPNGDFRLDSLILRYRPFADNTLNLQAGKFPTIVGNWVPTHHYYEDPFLLAPLPYSAITGINVNNPVNHSPQAIEARANASNPTIHRAKTNWSSIIWGPAYANGFAAFGSKGNFDYAFEFKNTSLGSSPDEWDFGQGDFGDPLIAARFGYRPDAAWAFGLSASHGPYLNAGYRGELGRGDFNQSLIGLDLRWSHRNWIVSGEAFFSTYDALTEDLQTFSYYVQARYKAAPGLWFAGRFGQTLSNEITVPSGGQAPWSPELLRAEISLGWRITPELLLKTQYAYTDVSNDLSSPSNNLFALSLGWKF